MPSKGIEGLPALRTDSIRHSELATIPLCCIDFESAAETRQILQSEGKIYEKQKLKE